MNQTFWITFWANLSSSISAVVILALVGYIAKHRISKNLKKFISDEVKDTLNQIRNYKN